MLVSPHAPSKLMQIGKPVSISIVTRCVPAGSSATIRRLPTTGNGRLPTNASHSPSASTVATDPALVVDVRLLVVSANARSRALWNRWVGDFSRHRRTTWSSA